MRLFGALNTGRLVITLLVFVISARGEANKNYLKGRLLNQPLYLRGMWMSDDLHFDGDGHLLAAAADKISFTLAGVELRKLDLKSDRLLLSGHRVGLELDSPDPRRVVLTLGGGKKPREVEVNIEILRSPSGDYSDALDVIFTSKLEDMVPALPAFWQLYASEKIMHTPYSAPFQMLERPREVGGEVTEPILVKTVEANFTPYAKSLQYKGQVRVSFTLGRDAKPTNFVLIKPLGLGLDEAAVEAIKQYTFGPATFRGKTVAVNLTIETSFQIY